MAIFTEIKTAKIDEFNLENNTFSVVTYNIILKDNEEIARTKGPRRAFAPGQFDEVYEWLEGCEGIEDIDNLLHAMWTQEAIDNYNAIISAQD
jgi:hypothetical protein